MGSLARRPTATSHSLSLFNFPIYSQRHFVGVNINILPLFSVHIFSTNFYILSSAHPSFTTVNFQISKYLSHLLILLCHLSISIIYFVNLISSLPHSNPVILYLLSMIFLRMHYPSTPTILAKDTC